MVGPTFVNGDVAMMARWSSGIAAFGRTEGFRFGIAPYPIGPSEGGRYASDIGASIYMVASTTENPEAAWRWAAFLGGREAAAVFGELGPGVPIHPGVPIGFIPDTMLFPEVLFDLIDLPNSGNQYRLMSKNASEINRLVDAGFARIMTGEVPAETEMPEIARVVNAFLAQNPQ